MGVGGGAGVGGGGGEESFRRRGILIYAVERKRKHA